MIGVLNFIFIYAVSFALDGHHRVGLILGLSAFFIYFVGGMGVRESSFPAAATVFGFYALNQVGGGQRPGIIAIILGAVLLSNVRATFLASRWRPAAEDEDRPSRFNETLRDKLVDQLPPRVWPVLRIPFFVVTFLFVLFLAYALARASNQPKVSPNPSAESSPIASQSSIQNATGNVGI